LDDSANRRLTLPQAFLGSDAVLCLALNVTKGLVVHPQVIAENVAQSLPFMATENILMAAVAKGGDRQLLHELIRRHSHAVASQLKAGSKRNDLIDRLRADPAFRLVDFDRVLDPSQFVGRAPQQVEEFMEQVVTPVRQRYVGLVNQDAEVSL
jgi:adenylosuccinate lyase